MNDTTTPPLLATRDALAEVLRAHVLGGDTAQQYDQAGQCSCGQKFYEVGGGPTAYLLANRRLLDAHAAHISDALLASGVVRDPATLADDETLVERVAVLEGLSESDGDFWYDRLNELEAHFGMLATALTEDPS